MRITMKWLNENRACIEGLQWFKNQKETDVKIVIEKLIKEWHLDWANWTISRALNKKNKIAYAIFAAEQVLGIYESKYPSDKRVHDAIKAAKVVLKHNTAANRSAACDAAAAYVVHAANAAAAAAYAADAIAAAHAANAAAAAAYAADAYAADAIAAHAAYIAANAAANAANAAAEMKTRIIHYGLSLI